jgi:hypothetical protein
MLRVDCYDFFELGRHVHPLTILQDKAVLNDVWLDLYWAKNEISSFFNIFPLKTSLTPGRASQVPIVL